MCRRFKTTIFLLLLALPVQGMATATMLFCDVTPPPNKEAVVSVMSGGHHHAGDSHTDSVEMAETGHHSASSQCQGSAQGDKCAGCTAYCTGTLITPASASASAPAMRNVQPVSSAPASSPSPRIDGLYRPPRPILA
jgi:hypothetical protein